MTEHHMLFRLVWYFFQVNSQQVLLKTPLTSSGFQKQRESAIPIPVLCSIIEEVLCNLTVEEERNAKYPTNELCELCSIRVFPRTKI
jgi:hypothetical protein